MTATEMMMAVLRDYCSNYTFSLCCNFAEIKFLTLAELWKKDALFSTHLGSHP